jgi:phosphoserine/homoserine phosphotransferase
MNIVCLDLEGVLIPEIWISLAERCNLPDLRRTTRDEPDYDVLMRYRLDILDREGLGIKEVQETVATMDPLPGAKAFLDELRKLTQVIILSDTFEEFARPLLEKIGSPTIFCHNLEIEPNGRIANYCLRQPDQKRKAVLALQSLNFKVFAAGDSFNDLTMLQTAEAGFWYCPPALAVEKYPMFPVANDHKELLNFIRPLLN